MNNDSQTFLDESVKHIMTKLEEELGPVDVNYHFEVDYVHDEPDRVNSISIFLYGVQDNQVLSAEKWLKEIFLYKNIKPEVLNRFDIYCNVYGLSQTAVNFPKKLIQKPFLPSF